MKIKADLIRSPERLRPARCQVEKMVEVDGPEFDAFLGAPREAWPFLEANAELMHQWMGVDHCLLVLAEGRVDGVLVNSEGSGRARYAAYLPQARAMVTAELDRAADLIVQRCAANTGAGSWQAHFNKRPARGSCRVPLEELEEQLALVIRAGNGLDAMLLDALRRRPEVSAVELSDGCINTEYNMEFRITTAAQKKTPPAPFTTERKAQLFERTISTVCEIFDHEDLYTMLHDSFGLTLQEIRAHNYMSDQEIAQTCGIPEALLGCDMTVRDVLRLEGVSESAALAHKDSTVLIPLEDLEKLTASGREDFAVLLDARVADIRVDDGEPELVLAGVEAAELERFCDALGAHEQAEQAMGDMTP